MALGFDVNALSTSHYVTNEYEITESFENISIKGDTEDITFRLSDDGKCRVVCFEDEKELHNVRVETKTLTIDIKDKNKWHFTFGINMESPTITVYLPEKAYGSLVVDADTGDVTGTLLTDKIFLANTDTGRVDVPRTVSGGRCEITTDTGDINISIRESDSTSNMIEH